MRAFDTRCLLVALATAACGGSERPDPPPSGEVEASHVSLERSGAGRDLATVNVCELVAAEVVAEAMGGGTPVPTADYDPGFGGKGCRYGARTAGYTRYVEVSLLPPGEFENRRQLQPGPFNDLPGLGDGAWWKHRVDRTEVNVLKAGDVLLLIQFMEKAAATREEESRRIAEAVLKEIRRTS